MIIDAPWLAGTWRPAAPIDLSRPVPRALRLAQARADLAAVQLEEARIDLANGSDSADRSDSGEQDRAALVAAWRHQYGI